MLHPDTLVTVRAVVIIAVVAAVVVTGLVFVLYLKAWIAAGKASASGLTPAHVTLVSLATLIPYATLAWRLSAQLGGPAQGPDAAARDALIASGLYLLGAVILIVSLIVVGAQQHARRVKFSRPAVSLVQRTEQIEIVGDDSDADRDGP